MQAYTVNIEGRVNNFNLPTSQPLIPLFEAVVNSFHAIEDRQTIDPSFKNGEIHIVVERDSQTDFNGKDYIPSVENFKIVDNGIGFNDENFKSFLQSDSIYKAAKGGKGVGRFSWLKAFEKVSIQSIYKDNEEYVKRNFDFKKTDTQVDDRLENTEEKNYETVVSLINFFPQYKGSAAKGIETIGMKIIQHCLIYFIDSNCPLIDITDGKDTVTLNAIFSQKINTDKNTTHITMKQEKFKLLHVKIEDKSNDRHKLLLCANKRVVMEKELDRYIVDLDRQIFEEQGFWYVGVLTGEYLDSNVDMNRLAFSNIPDQTKNTLMTSVLSMADILEGTCKEIEQYLTVYLEPIQENKIKKIEQYVTNEAPQYRHLIKYKNDAINKLKPNLTEDKLDDELYKIKRELDLETKKENQALLEKLNSNCISAKEYQDSFQRHIAKISDSNKAILAEYVAHRRVIIDLMEYGINKKEDGKFNKEEYLHNIIYPMRSTAEEINYDQHNLWLLDERLSYFYYISSDIPFNNSNKEERPDILMLDSPVAVVEEENTGNEYNSIVIFELKRPMRDDYGDKDNPISQVLDYVEKIKSEKVTDRNGRVIKASTSTKFYLYIICDVTPKIARFARLSSLKLTTDGQGYYNYNVECNAYIEILPYNKIINDSKKRNKILFDKLGI